MKPNTTTNYYMINANNVCAIYNLGGLTDKERETIVNMKLRICDAHGGKMEGIDSLSTSPNCNKICKARHDNADENCICKYCYSVRQSNFRKSLDRKNTINYAILNAGVIPDFAIPIIWADVFRFESFGDLGGVYHAINFIKIADFNPHCFFTLWTKNPHFISGALKCLGADDIPANMNVIISNPVLNDADPKRTADAYFKKYGFAGGFFSVFDKKHAESVHINCGALKCRRCMRCYGKKLHNELIFELKK